MVRGARRVAGCAAGREAFVTTSFSKPRPWEYGAAPATRQGEHEAGGALREAELLHRYYLGFLPARVKTRLEALFADPPADIAARLGKACEHLGVTGAHADLYALAAEHRDVLERLSTRVEAGAWPIGNPEVLKDYLKRARGDAEALSSVLAYVVQEVVQSELLHCSDVHEGRQVRTLNTLNVDTLECARV